MLIAFPQSLADRILAAGLERSACRVYAAAYDEGFSAGNDSGYDFVLNHIDRLLAAPDVRADAIACRTLRELAARIGQAGE